MRIPTVEISYFKNRRLELAHRMTGKALVIASHPEMIRNHDVHHPYRQDTNLFYLTAFDEPESLFVFRPGRNPESVLFVRKKDLERETWDGFRYGPDAAKDLFAMDQCYTFDQIEKMVPELLNEVDDIYYSFFKNREFDSQFLKILESIKAKRGRSGKGLPAIHDATPLLGEMRVRKSKIEIEWLKRACQITAEAHVEVMKATKPGVNERTLQGVFLKAILERGATREGYGSIVAGGDAATTLHYVFNDENLKAGDLLLVDAGAEYNYFGGDITRTFPVSEKFNQPQRRLYERILKLQKELIAVVKPGVTLRSMQDRTVEYLTDLMIEEGLLRGTRKDRIADQSFKKYYPHGVGHFLGMDVHDAGLTETDGQPRKLEASMTFTIEPGIYIPASDETAPKELRGIGIRIEDNVLVTDTGCEVMTAQAPKDIHTLESL